MRKILVFFVLIAMTFQLTSVAALAANSNTNSKSVSFYVQIDGIQMDANGKVSARPTKYFTGVVAQSELKQDHPSNYTIALGNNVSESDIMAQLKTIPDNTTVLQNVKTTFYNKGYIKSSDGKVIPWAKLTVNNYRPEWYVLKHENDGWHIDGRMIDISTSDVIQIVVPDDKNDIPKEAYEDTTKDTSIHLAGAKYAYIFGYEPIVETQADGTVTVSIQMGMDDPVTVEQVSSMLMRMLDQATDTMHTTYPITANLEPYAGRWYERGLAYAESVGAFDEDKPIQLGNITRGEVAKLVACTLKLNLSDKTNFKDIDNSIYKTYIEKVCHYGYMSGVSSDSFDPNRVMTRAEFCALFNNIIGRNSSKYTLTALDKDGNKITVTPETYYITDMDPSHWAYETCLKATSAYDDNGYVDLSTRLSNIRNILDKYNSQTEY